MVWRIVLAKIATYHEIMTHWDICDLYDAHEALDVQAEADEYYRREYQKRNNS